MEFGLSAEQTLLKDSVDHYLCERAPLDRVRRFADLKEGRATDLQAGLTELGVTALMIPESLGGVGLGALEACLVAETLGYRVTPVAYIANSVLVPNALLMAGSPAQQGHWLSDIASGKIVVGAALSELCGARNGATISVSAGKLSGRALFVLDFDADAYLIADSTRGLHLVLAKAAGLKRVPLETIDRTRSVGELLFDNVEAEPLVGANAEICRRLLDLGRAVLAADTLGAAQCMLDQAVAYAGQREQFGRVIASFQAVKHMCAEMAASLEPNRAMVWYAGHALCEGHDDAHLIACHAKANLDEVGRFVAKTATEVHGGMGFTDLLGLHFWFKRIGMNRQLLGSPERLRIEAARAQGLVA